MPSNFITINPTKANMENDAAYAADSLTTGGAGTGGILPSDWFNKAVYQFSIFCAAFGQMMSNKGISINDGDQNTLATALANVITTSDERIPIQTVPFSSSLVFDATRVNAFVVFLTGNVAAAQLINYQPGQVLRFIFHQDAAGGRVVPTISGLLGMGLVSTDPSATSVQEFVVSTNGGVYACAPMMIWS